MNIKEIFRDYQLKHEALLLAEQHYQFRETPKVFSNYGLKTLYDYYCHKLDQPLPKPGETVLYYDPIDDQPKPSRVIESLDSTTVDQPKRVMFECEEQTLELQDRHIYLLLYW